MYIGILLSVHYSIGGRSYVVITYILSTQQTYKACNNKACNKSWLL